MNGNRARKIAMMTEAGAMCLQMKKLVAITTQLPCPVSTGPILVGFRPTVRGSSCGIIINILML